MNKPRIIGPVSTRSAAQFKVPSVCGEESMQLISINTMPKSGACPGDIYRLATSRWVMKREFLPGCNVEIWNNTDFLPLYKYNIFIEGSLEAKLPTIWTNEKPRWEESEKRRQEERRQGRERVRRQKMQVREKVAKSRNTVFFPMIPCQKWAKRGGL